MNGIETRIVLRPLASRLDGDGKPAAEEAVTAEASALLHEPGVCGQL